MDVPSSARWKQMVTFKSQSGGRQDFRMENNTANSVSPTRWTSAIRNRFRVVAGGNSFAHKDVTPEWCVVGWNSCASSARSLEHMRRSIVADRGERSWPVKGCTRYQVLCLTHHVSLSSWCRRWSGACIQKDTGAHGGCQGCQNFLGLEVDGVWMKNGILV